HGKGEVVDAGTLGVVAQRGVDEQRPGRGRGCGRGWGQSGAYSCARRPPRARVSTVRVDSSRGVVVQRFQRAASSGSLSGQARGSLRRTGTDRQGGAGVAGEVAGVVGDSGTGGPRADPVYRLHLGDQVGGGQTRPFVTEVEERLGGGAQRTP